MRIKAIVTLLSSSLFLLFLFTIPFYIFSNTATEGFILFSAVLFIYLITAAGYIDTVDANPSIETALSLLHRQSFLIFPKHVHTDFYYKAQGDGWYTKLGIATPILYIPFVAAAEVCSRFMKQDKERLNEFFVSFFNCFITATLVTTLFLFLRLFHSIEVASFISIALAFCTCLFPYSKSAQREPLQALSLLGTLVFSYASTLTPHPYLCISIASLFASIGFLTKLVLIVPLLPGILYSFHVALTYQEKGIICFALPLIMGGVIWGVFAKHAYGNCTNTGYNPNVNKLAPCVWRTRFSNGIYLQWVSSKTGFFFYNPVLLLSFYVIAWKLYNSQITVFDLTVIFTILIRSCVYAKWKDPTGDQALGPRYLVAVIPLFGLLCLDFQMIEFITKKTVVLLLTLSFIFQIIFVSIKPQQYWTMKLRSKSLLTLPHWLANFKIFFHKTAGRSEIYSAKQFGAKEDCTIDITNARTLSGLNFWWTHLRRIYE